METLYQLRQMIDGCLNRISVSKEKHEKQNMYDALENYYLPRFIGLNKERVEKDYKEF